MRPFSEILEMVNFVRKAAAGILIYSAILYFGVSPFARYEMFIMPMILRGFGMMVLFIAYSGP